MEYFSQSNLEYIKKNFKKSWKFRLHLFSILPMGYLSGMKIKELDLEKCHVEVPYKWLNKNPFKSTFCNINSSKHFFITSEVLVRQISAE